MRGGGRAGGRNRQGKTQLGKTVFQSGPLGTLAFMKDQASVLQRGKSGDLQIEDDIAV